MTDKNELAEDRTDWSEDRTLLANERTFASWMRTGMACIGVALGLKVVFRDFEPTWLAKVVATVFIVASLFIFFAANRQARLTNKRMHAHTHSANQSTWRITALTVTMSIGAVSTGCILWFL